ncbi:hypothetical protein HN51_028359, partial [Arachis hypogaea]
VPPLINGNSAYFVQSDAVENESYQNSPKNSSRQRDYVTGFHKLNKKKRTVYSNAPDGNEPLALDMERMGKDQVWINGESIGRYWMTYGNGGCNSYGYLELIPLF